MNLSLRFFIAGFAILAFFAGNLAMANGHGAAIAGHHDGSIACENAQTGETKARIHLQDPEPDCDGGADAQCGDGPACCSSICHAVILIVALHLHGNSAALTQSPMHPLRLAFSETFLKRPPRI